MLCMSVCRCSDPYFQNLVTADQPFLSIVLVYLGEETWKLILITFTPLQASSHIIHL